MKKKKNLKKKILGVSLATLLVGMPFMTNKVEEVKAADCPNFYADYIFVHAGARDNEDFKNKTEEWVKIRGSQFPIETPEGAVLEAGKVRGKWIIAEGGAITDTELNYWSKEKIATDVIKKWNTNVMRGAPVKAANNHWIYYHDKLHRGEEITDTSEASAPDVDYSTNEIVKSMIFPKNETYGDEIGAQLVYATLAGKNYIEGFVKRTYSVAAMNAFGEDMIARGSGSSHPTETRWYAPAIYRVTYQVCSNSGSDNTDGNSGNNGGNNNGSDTSTNYTLTVNYYDKAGNRISNPVSGGSKLVNPSTQTKASGSDYSVVCPSDLKSGNTNYILDGKPSNASGVMDSNKTVNCYYTTDSSKTADIPIFIVWGIGGAALAYSIYFFRRYYKEQNEV